MEDVLSGLQSAPHSTCRGFLERRTYPGGTLTGGLGNRKVFLWPRGYAHVRVYDPTEDAEANLTAATRLDVQDDIGSLNFVNRYGLLGLGEPYNDVQLNESVGQAGPPLRSTTFCRSSIGSRRRHKSWTSASPAFSLLRYTRPFPICPDGRYRRSD